MTVRVAPRVSRSSNFASHTNRFDSETRKRIDTSTRTIRKDIKGERNLLKSTDLHETIVIRRHRNPIKPKHCKYLTEKLAGKHWNLLNCKVVIF